MTLTFAETYNMVAYLTKSDASEGFNQIIDFLHGSSIKYALTVNPNIYVSCIKQFWTTVAVKKVNDVIRLQALVDKKKVVVTEAIIREALHLDEADSEVEEGDADENEEHVNAGDAAEGDVSAANDDVPTVAEEPSIPSPTPPTPPSQPSQDIPSTSQIAQALEITKLKRRVKKLERNKVKVLKLRRLQKVGTSQRIGTSDDTMMEDVSNQGRMIADMDADVDVVLEEAKEVVDDSKDDQDVKVDESVDIQGKTTESEAKIYKIDLDHANKVLSMQEDETEPSEVQKVVDVVTTAKIITEVVTTASTTITAAKVPVPAATTTAVVPKLTTAPRRRTKGVVIRDPEESSTTISTIILGETKSKIKGKGILTKEQIKEEESRALKRINETLAERAAKRQKLDEEVEELKKHLQIVPNEDDDVYTEATPLARKVPVVDYEKNQRSVHGPAKVKGWKLLETCGVQIIKFTTTQLILLVERKYPLTRFTLDQMLNAVRLEVEEESEVSLELLSFGVDAAKEFKKNMLCV
uniref:Xylulose kinase-1 n=1 Tax=Tanacetum cinerariifolium TaxID=118510 RepID=A0A699JG68_TANCI|nr:xylulose kinase-1 [Tanacetum cinerariifolium]